jgi:hypothetical protein
MENFKTLTREQIDLLNLPLPHEAVTPHPTKKFLSSIKSIYVTERINAVFGVGRWRIKTEIVENSDKMIVIKTFFSVPEYGIEYECYGGNDNSDRGDAFKGATTDAITKIGSWLGIGADVFKGKHSAQAPKATATPAQPRKRITDATLDDRATCDSLLAYSTRDYNKSADKASYNAAKRLALNYDIAEDVMQRYNEIFKHHLANK